MTRQAGAKLAPVIARAVSDAVIYTKTRLASHEKEVRRRATQEVIDGLGRGIADFYRPVVDKLLDQDSGTLSPELRQIMEAAKSGEHQEQAIAGLLLGPVAGAIGTLLNNELVDVVYPIVRQNPNLHNPVDAQAQAAARGIRSYGSAAGLAADQGTPGNQFDDLYQLSQLPPDLATLLLARNRNVLDPGEVQFWLKRAGYHENVIAPLMRLHEQPLSPADAALAVLRTNITHGDGVRAAAMSGVSADDFETLIGNTGEPPGVSDMLAMYRRDIIDKARLEHGILQSRVRNEWIPSIEAMRFQPMTTADAIDATVQNHIDEGTAKRIAEQNGLLPEHFEPLRQTAGEPLSKTEMLRLHRMGKVTTEEVKQALRESRLKNKYIDHALELTVQIPPIFTIRGMIASGAITDAQARELLKEDGYQDFVIEAVLKAAHKTKTTKTRDLTESMIAALYREHAISAGEFRSRLEKLGYSAEEATDIQTIYDEAAAKAERDNAVAHLRTAFEGYKISETDVQHRLNELLVPAPMVEKLLHDWKLARVAAVRHLTPAQVIAAWRLKLFTQPETLTRLQNLGYSDTDARIMLEIANKGKL